MSQNVGMKVKIRAPRDLAVFGNESVAAWLNAAEVILSTEHAPSESGVSRIVNVPMMAASAWDGLSGTPEQIGAALQTGLRMVRDGTGWTPVDAMSAGLAVNARVLSLRKGDAVIRRAIRTNPNYVPYIREPNDSTIPLKIGGQPAWWVRKGTDEPYITVGVNPAAALASEARFPLEIETARPVENSYR